MPDTAIEYLVGSAVRLDTLRSLRDHGMLSTRSLEERVAASRRTLKRTLGTMESRGWVRSADGEYELTSLGGTMLSAYEEFRHRERIAERLRPVLEQTPAASLDLDVETLADSNVIHPGSDPTAPIDRLLELRADAAEIKECAPFLLFDTIQQLADRATEERSPPDVTLVLEDGAPPTDRFPSGYQERFEEMVNAPSVDVHVHPDDIRFAFGVADDHAFIVGLNLNGIAHTVLDTADPAVVDWVERTFAEYVAASSPGT